MSKIKNYKDFVNENMAEPAVTPAPTRTKPGVRPGRPSPIRRDKPDVQQKPKAEAEDIINKFLANASETDRKEILDQYEEA